MAKTQDWYCDRCGDHGSVPLAGEDSPSTVMNDIRAAHGRLQRPECVGRAFGSLRLGPRPASWRPPQD